jgi:hypothetical protein
MTSAGVRVFGVSVAIVGVLVCAAAFVPACATGDTSATQPGEDVGTDGSVKDTGGDGPVTPDGNSDVPLFETGPNEIPIGSPCNTGDLCAMGGTCTEITPGKSYCTIPCGAGCPTGSYCSTISGNTLCAPDVGNECARCAGSIDCPMPTDQCVTSPLGDKFCARDCTTMGDCPSGFDCVDAAGYPAVTTPAGDAGAGPRICVPTAGGSCACDSKRDGVTRTCSVTNSFGTCSGSEKCNASKSAFEGCDARTPAAETCNGIDDDCNGKIDDGDPNVLCAGVGPLPPNTTSWACSAATTPPSCTIGTCNAGWTDYPVPTDPKTGCTCPIDGPEPNDTCASPTTLTAISDGSTTPTIASGTLSSDTDVDVYQIAINDVAETNTNSFHVHIEFDPTNGNPGSEFVFDVVHGGTCADSPDPSVSLTQNAKLTQYDWCVDGTGSARGEAPCNAATAGQNHCGTHTTTYWLRVHRASGVTPTCNPYKINVTAKGGPACDFAAGRCEG